MQATAIVTRFIEHLNAMRMDDAFALLADDIVYHNIPMQAVTGPAAVKAVFGQIGFTGIEFIVHVSAEANGNVLNERTDRFRLADGRWLEIRVMGVFKVADGQITEWRDYFDLGQWMAQMTSPQ